jgi:hypothetical protein
MATPRRGKGGKFIKGSGGGGRRRRTSVRHDAPTVRIVKAAAPIVRVSAPRIAKASTRHKRRSSSGGGGMFGNLLGRGAAVVGSHQRTALVVGGAALGYAHKEGWLAKVPIIGKAGPVTSFGLLGWGAKEILKMKLPEIVDNAVTCALVLSAFNYTASGGQQILGQGDSSSAYYPGGAVFFD